MNTDVVTTGELFELLTKATRDAVWNWNLETNTIWWNEGYTTLFGYNTQEVAEDALEAWVDHIHPQDKDRVLFSIHQVLDAGGTNWSDEYQFQRADGRYATVLDRGYILYREGKPLRMVGAIQDITDRVALQKAHEESEERLRFALQSARLGTWELDPVRGVVNWDSRCQELCGLTNADSQSYAQTVDYIHPDDRSRVEEAVRWALNPLSGGHYETSFRTIGVNDRRLRWVRFIGKTHFSETGEASRFSGVAEDITEEVLAKEQAALSEQQARIALEGSGSGSFFIKTGSEIDGDNNILYSPSFSRILTGQESPNLSWKVFVEHLHTDDRKIRNQAHSLAVLTGNINYEARFVWVDKTIHWVKIVGQYLFDASGKPVSVTGIALDVSEQKERERALREAEERFSIAFSNTSMAMGFTDQKANFTLVNDAYTQLLGYSVSELYTLNNFDITHPDDRAYNRQLFEEVVAGNRPFFNLIKRYIHKDGSIRWVQLNVTSVTDAQDEEHSMIIIAQDISEQVEANSKIRASEERFRNMIIQAPVAISILNSRRLIVETANTSMLEIWGKDASIMGTPLIQALPELEGQGFIELLEGVYDSGVSHYGVETRARLYRRGDLEDAYFNFVYAPVRDDQGKISSVMVIATEVTTQMKAKVALQESEQRFRTLLEAIAQMTWTNTPEGEVNFYNQRWYDYTGLDFDQIKAWGWQSLVHPADLPRTLDMYKKALADGTTFVVENRYRRGTDGMYRWHLNRALPIRDELGEIVLWVGTATDIHEQKLLATQLEQQVQVRTEQLVASNQDLRRSNENLEKFAYIASHDLQEPLRKVQSFGDLLKNQYAVELGEGLDYLERMQSAASRMSLLIKDLLTFSRISTRQESTTSVSLNQVIEEVIDDLEVAILQVDAQIQVDLLPVISGDESQLWQLFQNLLSNALKFQQPGIAPVIRVQVEQILAGSIPALVQPSRQAMAYHQINVSDNGIGFDEKYVDRIFQVFQRLHTRNEYAGTGIGLAICEKVVANHGGAITAYSKPGKGATFTIYFPIA
ncbi:PAS domain-containing sensor histidine kinase [Spirosoma foliorum]|nr:PAS domain S-box protein [Spirosoma foliorum]